MTDRIDQFNGGVSKSDQPRNYPLSKSTALCVNTAFAYPYYRRLRGHRGRWPERRREEQEHPVLWTKEQMGPHDVEPA